MTTEHIRVQPDETVHLPQIITVGDQSAGKSLAPEVTVRRKYPAKGDTCNCACFVTELILRITTRHRWESSYYYPTANTFPQMQASLLSNRISAWMVSLDL